MRKAPAWEGSGLLRFSAVIMTTEHLPIKAMPAELKPIIMGISDTAADARHSLMLETREAEMPLHIVSIR
jgi:hypothetical protein